MLYLEKAADPWSSTAGTQSLAEPSEAGAQAAPAGPSLADDGLTSRIQRSPSAATRAMLLAAIPLALAGCQSSSTLDVGMVLPARSPVSETTEIREAEDRSVIGGYTHREPVEPRPWREQNERVSPGFGDEES